MLVSTGIQGRSFAEANIGHASSLFANSTKCTHYQLTELWINQSSCFRPCSIYVQAPSLLGLCCLSGRHMFDIGHENMLLSSSCIKETFAFLFYLFFPQNSVLGNLSFPKLNNPALKSAILHFPCR